MAKTPDMNFKVQIELGFNRAATLEELVGNAVGAASMCWEHVDRAGEFKSEQAAAITDALVHRIREMMEADVPDTEKLIDGGTGETLRVVPVRSEQEFLGNRQAGEDAHFEDWLRPTVPPLGEIGELDLENIGDGFGESIRRSIIEAGLNELVQQSGTNSRDHGFHQDRDRIIELDVPSEHMDELLRLWQISKLDLMHEELSEVLGELRDGRAFNEIYFLDKATGIKYTVQEYDNDGTPMFKPEGAVIELADLLIRAADLAFVEQSDLGKAVAIKHEYNASRPYLHGRKL